MAFLSSFYPQPVVAGITEGTYAEGDDSRILGAAQKASNLSDLVSASTARTNLGLGAAALLNLGTTAGTVAEGDKVAQLGAGSTVRVAPSNASTVERSLRDRFREVFHVDDYGAVGDWNGTTGTDDTAAIQAAINAAVAAGGGVVRFGAGKKYRLNTRNSAAADTVGVKPTHFLRVGSGNTTSGFGSTSMCLLFDGQGATLHATTLVSNQANDIIYTCCQFREIQFRDLSFTRENWITSTNGAIANAISFCQFDTNYHDLIRIENCYFYNNLHSIYFDPAFSTHVAWQDIRGKMKNLEVVGCRFEHPNGDSRARFFGGQPLGVGTGWGALVVFNSTWIASAVYDRCYADGLTNRTVPLEYHEPMHGFLFPMPIKCKITNCYFKNFYVEVIKASDGETAVSRVSINSGFAQPPVSPTAGSSIVCTINENQSPNQKLTVGKIYNFFDSVEYQSRRGGYFRLDAKTGGGQYTFTAGEELNFTRIDPPEYQMPSGRFISVGTNYSGTVVDLIDMDLLDQCSLQVYGCVFEGNPILKEDGTALNSAYNNWYAPAILCDYHCIVDGNMFIGGSSDFYTDTNCCNHHATIVTGNKMFKFTPRNDQQNNWSIFLRKSNCLIANNHITVRESRAVREVIFVQSNEIYLKDNICVVASPSSIESDGVTIGTAFVQYGGGGPWRVISENNIIRDLEHYGNSGDAGHIAHYIGSIRGTVARSGSQPIRLAKQNKSPDGSTWTVGITNDGELEVIK
jgi:hypothetical protein